MSKRIEYENKIALQNNESIPERNKVTDKDMNEIKNVINSHSTDIETLNNKYDTQIAELANENPQLPEIVDARQGYDTLGEAIKQKIYYFNTVAEMKASTKLQEGDICQTLGYYEANDGGEGLYKIVDDDTLVDDGGSVHELNNELRAKLIAQRNTVNLYQLGCKKRYTNCKEAIEKAITLGYKVIIPKGIWYISTLNLVSGAQIECENNNYLIGETATNDVGVLCAMDEVETLVDASNCQHLSLNLNLSSTPDLYNIFNKANIFLKLNNSQYNTINCLFYGCSSKGLYLKDSWENTFDKLYFRHCIEPTVAIFCDERNSGNISQNVFDDIQVEGFGYTVLQTMKNSQFLHNNIKSILVENTVWGPFETTEESSDELISIPLFVIEDGENNVLDTLQLNNYNLTNAILNNIKYKANNLITVNQEQQEGYSYGFTFKNIIFDHCTRNNFTLLKQTGINAKGTHSYIIIENLINPTEKYIKTEIESMRHFEIRNYNNRNTTPENMGLGTIWKWYHPTRFNECYLVSNNSNIATTNIGNNECAVVKIPNTETDSIHNNFAKLKVPENQAVTIEISNGSNNQATVDFYIYYYTSNSLVGTLVTKSITISANSTKSFLIFTNGENTEKIVRIRAKANQENIYIRNVNVIEERKSETIIDIARLSTYTFNVPTGKGKCYLLVGANSISGEAVGALAYLVFPPTSGGGNAKIIQLANESSSANVTVSGNNIVVTSNNDYNGFSLIKLT